MTFHPDLRQIVDWAWTHRAPILDRARATTARPKGQLHYDSKNAGIATIYGAICGVSNNGRAAGDGQIREFKRVLCRKLHNNLPGNPSFHLQTSKFKELRSLNDLLQAENIEAAFIHCVKDIDVSCSERVYVHLKEETRARAFSAILKKIWPVEGLCSAKVAAPGSRKTDTVVIYCDLPKSRQEIIRIIQKYQKKHVAHFNALLPKMVASVGLGIGHGAEPPSKHPLRPHSGVFEGVDKAQSFSYYRATLIFIALERTMFPEDQTHDNRRVGLDLRHMRQNPRYGVRMNVDQMQNERMKVVRQIAQKQDFERRVQELFTLAGLSVERPEVQGDANFVSQVLPPPTTQPPGN